MKMLTYLRTNGLSLLDAFFHPCFYLLSQCFQLQETEKNYSHDFIVIFQIIYNFQSDVVQQGVGIDGDTVPEAPYKSPVAPHVFCSPYRNPLNPTPRPHSSLVVLSPPFPPTAKPS